MSTTANGVDLDRFFPSDLVVRDVFSDETDITIKLKSISKRCRCPSCGTETDRYHGTYIRKVQDLPILGKRANLHISAHEYKCINPECPVSTVVETYDGFLNYYSRMTERCAMLISVIAMETSCEGCSRICKAMGIKISGDSVIRLLVRRFEQQEASLCPDVIGIDDFAFRKRSSYGTVIVDGETHKPIDILDGRDGETLRQWLKNNKHIKTVTRDRASAYAKVISEELPDAIQVADRFHLYQNLLEAVKSAIGRSVPPVITISNSDLSSNGTESPGKSSKKTTAIVENFSISETDRHSKICNIQSMLSEGYNYREIIRRLGVSPKTISKFRMGDPNVLCRSGIRNSRFDPYRDMIDLCLKEPT